MEGRIGDCGRREGEEAREKWTTGDAVGGERNIGGPGQGKICKYLAIAYNRSGQKRRREGLIVGGPESEANRWKEEKKSGGRRLKKPRSLKKNIRKDSEKQVQRFSETGSGKPPLI